MKNTAKGVRMPKDTEKSLLYFQVCVGDGAEPDKEHDAWYCICGRQEPTTEEALQFLRSNHSMLSGNVKVISELTPAAACAFFDFMKAKDWPIFDRSDVCQ